MLIGVNKKESYEFEVSTKHQRRIPKQSYAKLQHTFLEKVAVTKYVMLTPVTRKNGRHVKLRV